MAGDTLGAKRGSFPDLYVDLLWNLFGGAQLMKAKLPAMADTVSDQHLATLLRDTLGQASHAADQLTAMLAQFEGPARVHAAELETLLGDAARRLPDWPPGDTRDAVVTTVVRCVMHSAMPGCELAIVLAEVIGLTQHIDALQALHGQMRATDDSLRRLIDRRIRASHAAGPVSPG
jgi:ferritin-like metal-binding protein YciE